MTYYQWSMECILPEGVCWHSCRHIGHVCPKRIFMRRREGRGGREEANLFLPRVLLLLFFCLTQYSPASVGLYFLTVLDCLILSSFKITVIICWQIQLILHMFLQMRNILFKKLSGEYLNNKYIKYSSTYNEDWKWDQSPIVLSHHLSTVRPLNWPLFIISHILVQGSGKFVVEEKTCTRAETVNCV